MEKRRMGVLVCAGECAGQYGSGWGGSAEPAIAIDGHMEPSP
ncbi:hypothetical protein APS_1264 [Acetobacter pasteurianus subsp. pasteurianus LMG 1262 = NBRC 106471]|nr:hypothetical protein APS_1264 [Acetobacter pasteurianus subsp. pasteurianus LMG 1262 = NBRC 106471]